jgi:hypothetical protein
MPTPISFTPGNLQWIGIAAETVNGTAAAAPTVWIPASSPKLTPHIAQMTDEALRGSMAKTYGSQLGIRYDVLSYSTYLYADSAFVHLLSVLGTPDTVSGAGDPYTHKTSLLNSGSAQPKSHTLFYADGTGQVFILAGCQNSNLKITAKVDGLVALDVEWTGFPATNSATPANTPTTAPPAPGWNSVLTIGGTAMSRYSEVGITYKRATEPILAINGSQAPAAIYCGELDVNIDLTAIYQGTSDTDWVAFLANTQPALTLKLAAAGDATHALTLQHSKVAYSDVSFSGSNKWMEIQSKCTALANPTDALSGGYSPALATLTSAASTAFV